MAYTEASKRRSLQYAAEHYKRVPLDVYKSDYDGIRAAAEHAGESVNAYIREAVRQRMERDAAAGEAVEQA